jgi:secreted trypsin-like serine protease
LILSWYSLAFFQVVAGSSDKNEGTPINVTRVINHPDYYEFEDWQPRNDISILKLEEKIIFNDRRRPLALPTPNFNVPSGRMASIAGWGRLERGGAKPDLLQSVQVPVYGNGECQRIYSGETIFPSHICAGEVGHSSCQGDSGGA